LDRTVGGEFGGISYGGTFYSGAENEC